MVGRCEQWSLGGFYPERAANVQTQRDKKKGLSGRGSGVGVGVERGDWRAGRHRGKPRAPR